jgi:hypothetical protein
MQGISDQNSPPAPAPNPGLAAPPNASVNPVPGALNNIRYAAASWLTGTRTRTGVLIPTAAPAPNPDVAATANALQVPAAPDRIWTFNNILDAAASWLAGTRTRTGVPIPPAAPAPTPLPLPEDFGRMQPPSIPRSGTAAPANVTQIR